MQILSLRDGGVLYEGPFETIKRTLEQAIKDEVNLAYADLRGADLRGAQLDSAQLSGACLWCADLSGADISDAYLHKSDFRLSKLKETCFAQSVLSACDFRGAHFLCTIISSANLSGSQFSCPSFLEQDFTDIQTMRGAVYHHYGEIECGTSLPPITLSGLEKRIIILDDYVLIGTQYYDIHTYKGAYSTVIKSICDMRDNAKGNVNALLRH